MKEVGSRKGTVSEQKEQRVRRQQTAERVGKRVRGERKIRRQGSK